MIKVKETSIDVAVSVHAQIPELPEAPADKKYFTDRYKGKEHLIVCAYDLATPTGYLIGYDKGDKLFYLWMAGVIPEYRNHGAFTAMIDYMFKWAQKKGYKKIQIKTRNDKREMLKFLVKNDFNFVSVETMPKIGDNRVLMEKEIK